MFKYELGLKVKCRITELVGMLTARSENINMCFRYYVQPKVNKDMKLPDGMWIDEDDIIVLSKGIAEKTIKKETGGPISNIK